MKYLPLYYKWLADGMPGESGICDALDLEGYDSTEFKITFEAYGSEVFGFWARSTWGQFCETRQNMMLIMSAYNNEL